MFGKDMKYRSVGVTEDGQLICKNSGGSDWSHYNLSTGLNCTRIESELRVLGKGDTITFDDNGMIVFTPRPLQYTDLPPGMFFEDARGDIFIKGVRDKKLILNKTIMECVVGPIKVLTQQEAMGKLSGITK